MRIDFSPLALTLVTDSFSGGRENEKYVNPNGWGEDKFIVVLI